MRIIIKWLPQAITLLDNIYRFYSEKSQTAAIRLYNKLLDSAEPLRVFPQAGPIEPLLKEYDCEFRSLVADVQAFMKTYRKAEAIVTQYNQDLAEWEQAVKNGQKPAEKQHRPPEKQSVRNRLRQLQEENKQNSQPKQRKKSQDRDR